MYKHSTGSQPCSQAFSRVFFSTGDSGTDRMLVAQVKVVLRHYFARLYYSILNLSCTYYMGCGNSGEQMSKMYFASFNSDIVEQSIKVVRSYFCHRLNTKERPMLAFS